MKAIERRIRRLEKESQRRAQAGPSMAEIIRERRRKRLLAEGKQPEPDLPPVPHVDDRGRPLKISEIILRTRAARRERERAEEFKAAIPYEQPGGD